MTPELRVNELITILLIIFGVGKVWGMFRERTEMRDWKEWRAQVDARFSKHEAAQDARCLRHENRDTERFDEAGERISRLASIVNGLPQQIEDRVLARFVEREVINERFTGVERRLSHLEQRFESRRRAD